MKKVLFAIVGVVILGLAGLGYYSLSITSGDVILDNVYINGVDVGNMTKEEATEALKNNSDNTGIAITLFDENYTATIDANEFGYGFDVEEGVNIAFGVGRSSNVVTNTMTILSQKLLKANELIEIHPKLIDDKFDIVFDEIGLYTESELKEGSFEISNGQVLFEEGSDGKLIDRDKMKSTIIEELDKKDPFKSDYQKEYSFELVYKTEERVVNLDDMKKVTGIIGEYTTKFNKSITGRVHNIKLAASSIDMKIIQPGETLSYNESTGSRSYENGYVNASVIVNGEYEQGVGGGVCQVSSTLYNAALYANLDIVERRNHSAVSTYVPISRDAVVFFGSIDLVIKNPYDYPIIIESFVDGAELTVRVYGNVETAPKVELSSSVIETKARNVVYTNDPTLPLGTEKVKTEGKDLVIGRLYKTVDGVTTTVATDTYPTKAKEILVGIMEQTTASVESKTAE